MINVIESHGKNLISWKIFIKSIIAQIIVMLVLTNMKLNVVHQEDFGKIKGSINSIDPYDWFQWYFRHWLGWRSLDDKRKIAIWKGILSRFKGNRVKMIKGANVRFDDYSISSKIRHILLHWFYELVESHLLRFVLVW